MLQKMLSPLAKSVTALTHSKKQWKIYPEEKDFHLVKIFFFVSSSFKQEMIFQFSIAVSNITDCSYICKGRLLWPKSLIVSRHQF